MSDVSRDRTADLEERAVVTCFLWHRGAVLLLRRSDAVGSYAGRWGVVAGHAEGDPERAARTEIREETGLDPECDVVLVRAGDPFAVTDRDLGIRWRVHPFLFDCERREITPNEETTDWEWTAPTAILRRATVPELWTSYETVRPTVASIAADTDHGATALSVRALAVLRDEAALAVEGKRSGAERADSQGTDWQALVTTARRLVEARPSMAVLGNRADRVMAAASGERTPRAVEAAATAELERARSVDRETARRGAQRVLGGHVATLSRSGTVARALEWAEPASALVALSRPGGEGRWIAERLAPDTDVTLSTDAALGAELAASEVDALVVGADAVLPDGRVVNKVGTRTAATVAQSEDVAVYVLAATDKVFGDVVDDEGARVGGGTAIDCEPRDPTEVYGGDADRAVTNPTFDVTPPDLIDLIVTERRGFEPGEIGTVAAAHRERAAWRRAGDGD
jgi:translation initiation factor 2B subunit (eIF-2B alpha/beta/delta family)/8-oxo-dGTP pyrophosphatase MutT (NUDIX family)